MRSSARTTRLVAWLSLGCHALVASGLPLPAVLPGPTVARPAADRVVGKDRSRPFPCMDKACGCATAEQCFAACCCHTPAQRLAWARKHRVEPAVLAALERRVARTGRAVPRPAASCCAAEAADALAAIDAPDVCRDYRSLAADPAADHDGDAAPRVVILRDALACGGIVAAWLALGAGLPPPPRVEAPVVDALSGTVVIGNIVAPSVSADRSAPPPRAA